MDQQPIIDPLAYQSAICLRLLEQTADMEETIDDLRVALSVERESHAATWRRAGDNGAALLDARARIAELEAAIERVRKLCARYQALTVTGTVTDIGDLRARQVLAALDAAPPAGYEPGELARRAANPDPAFYPSSQVLAEIERRYPTEES